jgi:hypothetical protein
MATPNHKHWGAVRKKDAVLRDLIRLQHAPVPDSEASLLYAQIKAEVAALGLPESDATWFYHKLNRDQWKFCGVPITDWRATVANWFSHQFFPSQR